MGSTLAFFLNLRVHQISTFFFSRHAFNFFFYKKGSQAQTRPYCGFFSLLLEESFHTLINIRCIYDM